MQHCLVFINFYYPMDPNSETHCFHLILREIAHLLKTMIVLNHLNSSNLVVAWVFCGELIFLINMYLKVLAWWQRVGHPPSLPEKTSLSFLFAVSCSEMNF